MKKAIVIASVFAAFFVILQVWVPIWAFYWVSPDPVSQETMLALKEEPSKEILDDLSIDIAQGFALDFTDTQILKFAAQLHDGVLELPNNRSGSITLPFDEKDLTGLPGPLRLRFGSLVAPNILIRAYRLTGDESHYILARDIILEWIDYERSALIPNGFLWNDHAISTRGYVMSEFWSVYRDRPDFDQKIAIELLDSVARIGALLAKPNHYTAYTNHGIMQNIALLHLTVAFPEIPQFKEYQAMAFERNDAHMKYYLSDEGVILEHSVGYHEFGLDLLTDYARIKSLSGQPISSEWVANYYKAVEFYQKMIRPGGTLPKIGNTKNKRDAIRALRFNQNNVASNPIVLTQPILTEGALIKPLSGFSIWWDKSRSNNALQSEVWSQVVTTWSRFATLAHKHADELSMTLWRGDQPWVIGIGYWSYWSQQRDDALSWPSSNAPHLQGEALAVQSRSNLLGHILNPEFAALDIQRATTDNVVFRRQILRVFDDSFLVLDSARGGPSKDSATVWTLAPNLKVNTSPGNRKFRFSRTGTNSEMRLNIATSNTVNIEQYRGSENPFRGWMWQAGQPHSAPAIEIEWKADQWVASMFSFTDENDARVQHNLIVSEWIDAEHWEIKGLTSDGQWRLKRAQDTFTLTQPETAEPFVSVLSVPEDVEEEYASINQAYLAAEEATPRFRAELFYRERVSQIVVVLFLLQEFVLFGIRRFVPKLSFPLRIVSVFSWLGLGLYLHFAYLA